MDEKEKQQYLREIGRTIRDLRIKRGLSQNELATRCGYTSRSTINKIELGINDPPQSKLKTIADALDVPIGVLLGLSREECIEIEIDDRCKGIEYALEDTEASQFLRIIEYFRKLNDTGKEKLINDLEDLSNLPKYTK